LYDVANWLLWGLDENASNDQSLAPAFSKLVKKALNESSHRLQREVIALTLFIFKYDFPLGPIRDTH